MSKLVDSIRAAQATVSTAFDQLAEDVAAEEAEGDTVNPTVEKVTITYSDGSSVDFAPPGSGGGVEDSPAPKSDSETPTPDQAGSESGPGNSEQV